MAAFRPYHTLDVQEKSSRVLAMLLNKLATNALPDDWRPEGRKLDFKVQLASDSPQHCTPEDLLEALVGQDGSELHLQIVSRITAFGLGVLFVLYFVTWHCQRNGGQMRASWTSRFRYP
jgi:hypothetical protein